jgi:hypothetical protein
MNHSLAFHELYRQKRIANMSETTWLMPIALVGKYPSSNLHKVEDIRKWFLSKASPV